LFRGLHMFALPGFRPMTIPAASTEATDGLSEDHEIATSARGSPIAVRAMAFGLIPECRLCQKQAKA
jgi:hypothetical protein